MARPAVDDVDDPGEGHPRVAKIVEVSRDAAEVEVREVDAEEDGNDISHVVCPAGSAIVGLVGHQPCPIPETQRVVEDDAEEAHCADDRCLPPVQFLLAALPLQLLRKECYFVVLAAQVFDGLDVFEDLDDVGAHVGEPIHELVLPARCQPG